MLTKLVAVTTSSIQYDTG